MVSHGLCGFWVFHKSLKPRETCSTNSSGFQKAEQICTRMLGDVPKCLMYFSSWGSGFGNTQVSFLRFKNLVDK